MTDDLRNRVARARRNLDHGDEFTAADLRAILDDHARLTAALAEIGSVRVRELAWDDEEVMAGGVMTYGSALSPFGRYYLTETGWFGPGVIHSHEPDSEAAKADVKVDYTRRILAAIEPAPHHPDDLAVDRFAAAMKEKLRYSREIKNRGGWERKDEVPASYLSRLLREHVDKGDPLDVGNLAMMLHQRGDSIEPAPVSVREAALKAQIHRLTAAGDNLTAWVDDRGTPDVRKWDKARDEAFRAIAEGKDDD